MPDDVPELRRAGVARARRGRRALHQRRLSRRSASSGCCHWASRGAMDIDGMGERDRRRLDRRRAALRRRRLLHAHRATTSPASTWAGSKKDGTPVTLGDDGRRQARWPASRRSRTARSRGCCSGSASGTSGRRSPRRSRGVFGAHRRASRQRAPSEIAGRSRASARRSPRASARSSTTRTTSRSSRSLRLGGRVARRGAARAERARRRSPG